MREFLAATASVFRARATQALTVGLASVRWLSLVEGLDLDELQVHWYESVDTVTTLARPVASLGLDRPVLLGEFPRAGPRSALGHPGHRPRGRLLRRAGLVGPGLGQVHRLLRVPRHAPQLVRPAGPPVRQA